MMAKAGGKRSTRVTRSGTAGNLIAIEMAIRKRQRRVVIRDDATVESSTKHPSRNDEKTVDQIRHIMKELNLDIVKRHFAVSEKLSDDNCTETNVEGIEPFFVCDGVSVNVFNLYVYEGESLPIALRFLELDKDRRLLIVEYPLAVHELTTRVFDYKFLRVFGDGDKVAIRGSTKALRNGLPAKEGDIAFGPKNNTPNRTDPPPYVKIGDWITLAVEVGLSQGWKNLANAALWWYGYPGMQYVLLLKVSDRARSMKYWLYDVVNNPIVQPETLPAASHEGWFRYNQNDTAENITFDNRRILSIPPGQALPTGVNDFSVLNLRDVMTSVIESISS